MNFAPFISLHAVQHNAMRLAQTGKPRLIVIPCTWWQDIIRLRFEACNYRLRQVMAGRLQAEKGLPTIVDILGGRRDYIVKK